MKGVVKKTRLDGFYEVQTDSIVSVFELVGCSIVNVGDEIEGGLDSLGGKELTNITQNDVFDAVIQEIN
ncbi:hypothetical protein [Mangrovibacterium lignilyticum]|uniref:hypothetical protein n=1 Tax=Mangrovibacterium lignilyticum TaxID=2668052 RepID=UPI0013D5C2BC|nr:hypothetical protein [Mangrovibacterium lignilyticum]